MSFMLQLIVFENGLVAKYDFSYRIGKVSRILNCDIAFNNRRPRLLPQDDEIPWCDEHRSIVSGKKENMDRFLKHHTIRDVQKSTVTQKCGIQRYEWRLIYLHLRSKVPSVYTARPS